MLSPLELEAAERKVQYMAAFDKSQGLLFYSLDRILQCKSVARDCLMTNSALQSPTCIPVKTRLNWNRPSRLYTPVLVTFHGRPIWFVSRILVLERGEVHEHSHLMSHTVRDTF